MIIRIGTGIMLGLVLLIAGCSLTVDKTTLDFGDKETSMTFILKTSGVLTWSISCEHDWVTVVPTQGISNQAARTIEVIVDRTGLGLGDYEAALSISNNWRLPYKEVLIRMSVGEEQLEPSPAPEPTLEPTLEPTTTSTICYKDTDKWCQPISGKIVFVSDRDGNLEIYTMNADGSEQIRLTYTADDSIDKVIYYPKWSPDGTKIAFILWDTESDGIYTMNPDGSEQKHLANTIIWRGSYPKWSPDGQAIAFASDRDKNSEIYVMNADGTGQRNLTNNPNSDLSPSWFPNE